MEIEKEIIKRKELQSLIINFIDDDENDSNFQALSQFINENNFSKNVSDLRDLLCLLSVIANNHYRVINFFSKITQIIKYIHSDIQNLISNQEMFEIFQKNPSFVLYLISNKIIIITEEIISTIKSDQGIRLSISNQKTNPYHLFYLYLYHDSNKDEQEKEKIKKEIKHLFFYDFDTFCQFCQNGENDLKICDLIRHDSLNEFISYVNETNVNLDSEIPVSLYESNEFLLTYNVQPIEYAAFFGSIQIFKYLQMNKVRMRPILLSFAVHGRNSEIIHLIEENLENKPFQEYHNPFFKNFPRQYINFRIMNDNSPTNSLFESIKCHHNEIANYIKQNNCEMNESIEKEIILHSVQNYNYEFIPDKFVELFPLPKSCLNHESNNAYSFFYSIPKITLPSSLTAIAKFCFYGFDKLKEINIPDSVTSIGNNSFKKCKSLESVTFSNLSQLVSIGNSAFAECSSLKHINIPCSLSSIGDGSFKRCISLEQVTFSSPSSLTTIGKFAFNECSSLKEISIPSSVKSIAHDCFKLCSLLSEVSFEEPSSLTSIEKCVFKQCSSLKQIIIPSSINLIEDYAFQNCTLLSEIRIQSSVSSIGKGAFENCSSLAKIEIPTSIQSIESYTFQYCSSLAELSIPSSITSIGDYSFRKCSSLIQVIIPSSVTEIGKGTFEYCSSLKHIEFPSSINSIKDFTFRECSSLKEFIIQPSIVSIGNSSFMKCESLTQISIPSSVNSIGNDAFRECSSLSQVAIDSQITKISDSIFYKCKSLKKIVLPPSVTEIGTCSFYGCSSLENIEISSSINKIGDFAFAGCNLLQQSSLPKEEEKDEIQIYIQKLKELYMEVFNFLESETIDINSNLLKIIQEKSEDKFDLIELLNFLSKISENYFACPIEKIEKILNLIKEKIKEKLSNNKICHIFKENKRILLFLLENDIIHLDNSTANIMINSYVKDIYDKSNEAIFEYFKPELMKIGYKFNSKSDQFSSQIPDDFNEKRKIGQNDNKICKIIRADSIDEFIQYLKEDKANDQLIIPYSIYETNSSLKNNTLYIEYAAFYGSTKIFNYLLNNNDIKVSNNINDDKYDEEYSQNTFNHKKNQHLWFYAIQGNQSEIIHILEENDIKPGPKIFSHIKHMVFYYDDLNYVYDYFCINDCFELAIKCHHNDIAKYILSSSSFSDEFLSALTFSNFPFIDDFYNHFNKSNFSLLYNLCLFDYPKFAQILMQCKKININNCCNEFEIKDPFSIGYMPRNMHSDKIKIISESIKSNNEIINFLIEGQQNVLFNYETLFYAILNENKENVKTILELDPNINVNMTLNKRILFVEEYLDQISPLFLAVINRNIDIVKLLLNHPRINVNLSFEPKNGRTTYRTALHIAIILNDIEIVKLLLNHSGINVNALANFDETTCGFLSWSKANHFDHYFTPLHEAIELENVEIVKLLLNHPDILVNKNEIYDNYQNGGKDHFDRVRQTALCRAIQKQNYEIVKLLLEQPNIDVNKVAVYHQNDNYDPYVHNTNDEYGRDDNLENNEDDQNGMIVKRTALQFALDGKSKDIIQLLLNRNDIKNRNLKDDEDDYLIKEFTRDIK